MKEFAFKVVGMRCEGCLNKTIAALKAVPGVKKVELSLETGEIEAPAAERIAHVAQSVLETDLTALDYVMAGHAPLAAAKAELEAARASGQTMREASAIAALADLNEGLVKSQALTIMAGLGFSNSDAASKVKTFSGGWRNRLSLARALMCPADLLLLDEPTNHLDMDSLIWLEAWLKKLSCTVIIISHDREFLDRAVQTTWSVENGTIVRYAGNYSAYEQQSVEKMRLPRLVFHRVSCFDPGFFDELDGESGQDDIKAAGKKKRKQEYNAYIIALGDDESNIAMANVLLDDFKHENRSFKDGKVIVYVNVRDSRNRCRISWDDKDISRSEGHINVVLFGDASDMYTYRNIVDIDDDKKFNYAYQLLGGYTDDKDVNEKFKTDIAPIFKQGAQCSESFAEKVNEVIELLKIKVDDEQNEHYQKERDTKWMECSMMDRESNYGAKRFGYFFAHMLEEPDSVNEALIKRLSEIEHIRWSRFHMAYGWIYSGEKDKSIKEHNYLCPFEMLPLSEEEEIDRAVIVGGKKKTPSKEEKIDIRANDTINVLLAALLYGKKGKEGDL